MCVSAAVIAAVTVVTSAVSMGSSIASANANKRSARYTGELERKQMNERAKIERLAAMEAENARRADFAATRSRALAAIGASGLSDNISYFQGIAGDEQDQFLRDVRNIRLGMVQDEANLRDGLAASRYGVKIAGFNAKQTKIGAVAQFAKAAMSAASFYGDAQTGNTSNMIKAKPGRVYDTNGI